MKKNILLILGFVCFIICVCFFAKPNHLTKEEVERLRETYHTIDKVPAWYYSDNNETIVIAPSFEFLFDRLDMIVSGRVVSGAMVTDIRDTIKSFEGFKNWEGIEKNWSEVFSELEHTRMYPKYSSSSAYWYLEVENVFWEGDKEYLPQIHKGDKILLNENAKEYAYESFFNNGDKYVLTLGYDEKNDTWRIFKQACFYETVDGYLFSFSIGENSNRFTGYNEAVYKTYLKNAENKWKKAVENGTYVENYDFLKGFHGMD